MHKMIQNTKKNQQHNKQMTNHIQKSAHGPIFYVQDFATCTPDIILILSQSKKVNFFVIRCVIICLIVIMVIINFI